MRIQSSVTSISWIPSEAIDGLAARLPFDAGVAHYDSPPPDSIDDLEKLNAAGSFRFANHLEAWIEVDDGVIVGQGSAGRGLIGSTALSLGRRGVSVPAVPLPDIRPEPQLTDTSIRFVQTAGGRTGLPAPRRVRRKPFVQIAAPLAWTTLALTLHADGSVEHEVAGASPFPRHWIYDDSGKLAGKTGLIDFRSWWLEAFGNATPWGDQDSPALVTATETALERELSRSLMKKGATAERRNLAAGETLVEQGDPGDTLFLVLDGVLSVEVGGEPLAEVGPGSILGERAILERGTRTSTLRAVTPCRVAVVPVDAVDPEALDELAVGHRREDDAGA